MHRITWQLQRMVDASFSVGLWTPGVLRTGRGRIPLYTLELPWRDNKVGESRIKPDSYRLQRNMGSKGGLRLEDKHGRTDILIHVANWPDDVRGCIGPGLGLQQDGSGVKNSTPALRLVTEWFAHDADLGPVVLEIDE